MSSGFEIRRGKRVLSFKEAPLQELALPELERTGVRLWMLRGDLVHPFVPGNKAWKLKHNLREAIRLGKDRLVTFGGAYSNHLLAVAHAGNALGIQTTGIVRGDEPLMNPILKQCRNLGMELVQVSRAEYRQKDESLRRLGLAGSGDYVLPEGGSNVLAVEGCAEAVPEAISFDHIFVPVGTGGTLAGFALGANRQNPNCRMDGIVVLKGGAFLNAEIERLVPGLGNWKLHLNFHGGGYAKTTPELVEFVERFIGLTGVPLEAIYSGKMMMAVLKMVRDGRLEGKRVLCVH